MPRPSPHPTPFSRIGAKIHQQKAGSRGGQPGVLNEGYLHRDGPRRGFNACSRPRGAPSQARSTQARVGDGRVATVWRGDGAPERWDARARAPGIALDASPSQGAYAEMVARHAAANGVPASLVHRVIMRESRYNPRAISQGNYGIMQIRLSTARAMGYTGSASGSLDPEVNMTYAVKYLAGLIRLQAAARAAPLRTMRAATHHQARRAGSIAL